MRLLNLNTLGHHGQRSTRVDGRFRHELVYSNRTKITPDDYLYRAGSIEGSYIFYGVRTATHQRTEGGWFSYIQRCRITDRKEIIDLREKLDLLLTPVPDKPPPQPSPRGREQT